MCSTDALHCDDAAAIVGELDRVRRDLAALEAERTMLLDALRRANEAHEERVVTAGHAVGPASVVPHPEDGRATDASDWVARSTRAEVACVLRVSERAAAALIAEARVLCADLPATTEALRSGDISNAHARATPDGGHGSRTNCSSG